MSTESDADTDIDVAARMTTAPAVELRLTPFVPAADRVAALMVAFCAAVSERSPAVADMETWPDETLASTPADNLNSSDALIVTLPSVVVTRALVPEILTVPASTQVPPSDVQSPSLAALRSGPSAPLRQAPPVPVDDRLTAPPDEDRSTLEPLTLTNGASTVTPSPDVTLMSPVELFIDTPPAPWTSTRPAVASDRTLTLPADEPTVTPSEPLISTDPDDQVCPAEPQADSSAAATTAPALLRHTPAPLPCSNRAPAAVTCTSLPVDATVA